ncbi:indolepyruvate ferredoxin oxidoreductase subunit alpha [Dehalococcoides mccartyi]|uniref:indolepyruvate ferredoxin oxidoreductase subunit alpha n=1 Tax=Dehalococcoides mccartyi TaxID=61435 RepID=UPI00098EC444|nr:indolepyruvate ferredoxin oxidoreductase subunit alpha [Dehalococcoides mccartyi]AQU03223.1 indolepyruvate ferredoxin oxidoreductase subunit alpha [Dehalococcoides mccartyi]AQU04540.1 indolepyruvate ferredoxin oxidoreductase subunit alpha [Dehalococcoides mccartyi]
MKKLLSGNEALALGAYNAGLKLAAAYPGTPSTEIMENLARFPDIHTQWSSNEAVAVEVATGASYTGVRALAAMKHVGLNVAADAFMAASTTGVKGGLVIVVADDPGIHSSQNEQDTRHYARLSKMPVLEPSNSQEAYDFMALAFELSERFDTPVILRSTTRVSHSSSLVEASAEKQPAAQAAFKHDTAKLVMVPTAARVRWPKVLKREDLIGEYAENCPCNQYIPGNAKLGIISSGIAFQYAKEVFPEASFLKLGMTYPLPKNLIKEFSQSVETIFVVEELDSVLEDSLCRMGISAIGKKYIPRSGELNPDIIRAAAIKAGILPEAKDTLPKINTPDFPKRPPLLCAGCPHTGIFFTLSTLGQRSALPGKPKREPKLVLSGDIGCYTLGAYPPLSAMDTCGCMGGSISQAVGMEKAGLGEPVIAIIGDSTFMHSGINGLINAVYNQSKITILILDNRTTAMTGHQGNPGCGIAANGQTVTEVNLEELVRGAGIKNLQVLPAFDLKALRNGLKNAISSGELNVIIVRGECNVICRKRSLPNTIDTSLCNRCDACLLLGCPAIQRDGDKLFIDPGLCTGSNCNLCSQVCPQKAIKTNEAA